MLPYLPKIINYPVVASLNPSKKGSLGFKIQKSIVTAELEIDHIESELTALKSVEQTIQGLVDAYSFLSGDSYEVRMEAIKREDKIDVFKGREFREFLPNLTDDELPKVEFLMSFAVEHMSLRFALSNFKNAKHYTAYTGLYIYLVVENIKKYFYPIDLKNEGKEWLGLRQKLSLSREDIDFVKTFADHVRHGKYQDISGKDNTKILTLGAGIIYKFYKYLLDLHNYDNKIN